MNNKQEKFLNTKNNIDTEVIDRLLSNRCIKKRNPYLKSIYTSKDELNKNSGMENKITPNPLEFTTPKQNKTNNFINNTNTLKHSSSDYNYNLSLNTKENKKTFLTTNKGIFNKPEIQFKEKDLKINFKNTKKKIKLKIKSNLSCDFSSIAQQRYLQNNNITNTKIDSNNKYLKKLLNQYYLCLICNKKIIGASYMCPKCRINACSNCFKNHINKYTECPFCQGSINQNDLIKNNSNLLIETNNNKNQSKQEQIKIIDPGKSTVISTKSISSLNYSSIMNEIDKKIDQLQKEKNDEIIYLKKLIDSITVKYNELINELLLKKVELSENNKSLNIISQSIKDNMFDYVNFYNGNKRFNEEMKNLTDKCNYIKNALLNYKVIGLNKINKATELTIESSQIDKYLKLSNNNNLEFIDDYKIKYNFGMINIQIGLYQKCLSLFISPYIDSEANGLEKIKYFENLDILVKLINKDKKRNAYTMRTYTSIDKEIEKQKVTNSNSVCISKQNLDYSQILNYKDYKDKNLEVGKNNVKYVYKFMDVDYLSNNGYLYVNSKFTFRINIHIKDISLYLKEIFDFYNSKNQ